MFRRQIRQGQNLYPVFSQLTLLVRGACAVNILLFSVAIMHFARFISKFIADICKFSFDFLLQGPHRHS